MQGLLRRIRTDSSSMDDLHGTSKQVSLGDGSVFDTGISLLVVSSDQALYPDSY